MSFKIVNEDITTMDVDVIVNAANNALQMGGGVCGAIFRAAGEEKLEAACNKIRPIKTGEAVITDGFDLKAKYIIHTAGPIFNPGDTERTKHLLEKSYMNSLELAKENGAKSIAFPLISAGIYGYPKFGAYEVAKSQIEEFLKENDMEVYLTIVDDELFEKVANN